MGTKIASNGHDEQPTKTARIAQKYIRNGFAPIPIPNGSKNPNRREWEKERHTVEDAPRIWNNGQNIGLLNGKPSDWRVVIDLDVDEAVSIAGRFLPPTRTSGRKPHSHWWFRSVGATTTSWKDLAAKTLLELRSTGCHTVVAPSTHPEGPRYQWYSDLEIAEVEPNELTEYCQALASATLIARHLPPVGGRHDLALALAGFLLKRLDEKTVLRILTAAWHAGSADSQEALRDLKGILHDTDEKLKAGEPVVGGGRLEELIPGLVKVISRYWGWRREPEGQQKPSSPESPTHDELRDRWIAAKPGHAYGGGEWRRYEGGIWLSTAAETVKRQVAKILEQAKNDGVRPTASLLASVTELARIEVFVEDELWDADSDILVCENGALRLSTAQLLPHSPAYYATCKLAYAYDPAAKAPVWDLYLQTTLAEVADFLQEFAGYCLTTNTAYELALWLLGPSGCGKSTFIAGLEAMLGARVGVLGLADLERNRFALASLPGKTLMVATEQPNAYLSSTHLLNAIISGEPVQVERKYQNPYTIVPRAKLLWAMNDAPRVGDANNGIFRRVKVVKFPERSPEEQSPDIREMITREGAGILNWALEGLQRLRERGFFEIPPCVAAATAEFEESNDVPGAFLEACCSRSGDARAQASKLYEAYKLWCEKNGHKPLSSSRVASDWDRLGFKKGKVGGVIYYYGVQLENF